MAYTVPDVHVKMWESQVRFLAQQTDARLRPWVQEKSGPAASRSWTRQASQDFTAKGARGTNTAVATIIQDSQYTGRVAAVSTVESSDLVEQDEIEQVAFDPLQAVQTRLAYGARRAIDSKIIAAATANAVNDAGVAQAFDTSMILGDYTTEFNFDMVTRIGEALEKKNVPPDEPKVLVIGPTQRRALMHEARATSTWFVDQKALMQGFVKDFYGFTIIVSNLLNVPAAGSLDCFAMTRKAIGLTVAKDIWVDTAKDPSASMAWRIYSALTMGAVRVEDEQIVWLKLKDTFTAP